MARLRNHDPEPGDDNQVLDEREVWYRAGMRRRIPQLEAKIAGWRDALDATTDPASRAALEDTIARGEWYRERLEARAAGVELPRRDPRIAGRRSARSSRGIRG